MHSPWTDNSAGNTYGGVEIGWWVSARVWWEDICNTFNKKENFFKKEVTFRMKYP